MPKKAKKLPIKVELPVEAVEVQIEEPKQPKLNKRDVEIILNSPRPKCPYCGTVDGAFGILKYHLENCKEYKGE